MKLTKVTVTQQYKQVTLGGGGMPVACRSFWARVQTCSTAGTQAFVVITPNP